MRFNDDSLVFGLGISSKRLANEHQSVIHVVLDRSKSRKNILKHQLDCATSVVCKVQIKTYTSRRPGVVFNLNTTRMKPNA